MTMKKFADKKIILTAAFVFLTAVLFLPGAVYAGQTVDVNTTISDAYGNSSDGGASANEPADGNTLNVGSGGVVGVANGAYLSSTDDVTASGNAVNILSGGYAIYVFGAQIDSSGAGKTAAAQNNTVTVDGQTHAYAAAYGGYAMQYGSGGTAIASGNSVVINSGTFSTVHGGYASANYPTGTASATGNTVTINGGAVDGDVVGGYVSGETIAATGNTVNINGGAFSAASIIKGGDYYSGAGDVFTGNTLNLRTPIKVGNVQNFEFYNFYLPAAFAAGDAMLTVSGVINGDGAYLSDGGSGRSTVNVGIAGSAAPLKKGDRVTLIDASASYAHLVGSPANTGSSGTQGVTLKYKFALSDDSYKLYADVTEAGLGEESKALSEGRAANLAAVTAGGDLIADAGMKSGFAANRAPNAYTFGAMSYNSSRYDTGSYVDGGTFSVLAGLARGRAVKYGALTYGGFVEAGWGNYDTYNSFANAAAVRGSGDANYYGAGLSFRMNYDGNEKGHFYNDAAVRFGKSSNDYESRDLRDANGSAATYETDSGYYGAHFTLGYMKNLGDGANLDLYTRLLWTHLGGDDTTLSTGDPVSFDGADSWRWRTGLRYAAPPKNGARFYAGAAYEYEFAGGVDATAYGLPIESPSLEGGTAIGEIGFAYQQTGSPFSADLNLSGFTGQREGFGARINLNWAF
ncbi:MAG: autotransporter domain-containing protein [Synergistaceae bacterium]|jgi:hypothetical protein|nr:autotransporter domain-containing protein [Synergistaceae bacterium]